MPGNPKAIITEAERLFPVRIVIRIPGDGIGTRYTPMTEWLDEAAQHARSPSWLAGVSEAIRRASTNYGKTSRRAVCRAADIALRLAVHEAILAFMPTRTRSPTKTSPPAWIKPELAALVKVAPKGTNWLHDIRGTRTGRDLCVKPFYDARIQSG
jgi:hypothetical protein